MINCDFEDYKNVTNRLNVQGKSVESEHTKN